MSFLDRIGTKLNSIQNIKYKSCPKCGKDMYLARWFNQFICEKCDLTIAFTDEEKKLVTKFEREHGLHNSYKNKKK